MTDWQNKNTSDAIATWLVIEGTRGSRLPTYWPSHIAETAETANAYAVLRKSCVTG